MLCTLSISLNVCLLTIETMLPIPIIRYQSVFSLLFSLLSISPELFPIRFSTSSLFTNASLFCRPVAFYLSLFVLLSCCFLPQSLYSVVLLLSIQVSPCCGLVALYLPQSVCCCIVVFYQCLFILSSCCFLP